MRIITGSAKGVRLKTPHGLRVRPTGDRVKEALFNILGYRVTNAQVLDLFAGTGNLGLEALSRGAKGATFVEHSQASIALIRENALLTKLTEKIMIRKGNVLAIIAQLDKHYDLIFCDPPYNQNLARQALLLLDKANLLSDNGVLVVEHSQHESIDLEFNNLEKVRSEKFGDTYISFWQNK